MRKLVHELFKGPINISEKLTYIVVENPNVFYKMVKSLCNQVLNKTNAEEAFVLLDDESKLELSKSAIMFSDLLNFEINSKKIKNELIKKIEKDDRNLN
jgi:CRISPR type II-A-associated protein Csn2